MQKHDLTCWDIHANYFDLDGTIASAKKPKSQLQHEYGADWNEHTSEWATLRNNIFGLLRKMCQMGGGSFIMKVDTPTSTVRAADVIHGVGHIVGRILWRLQDRCRP